LLNATWVFLSSLLKANEKKTNVAEANQKEKINVSSVF
jgi:hypothetical protein